MTVRFLTMAQAIAAHAHVLELYGGSDGLRDEGRLRSALAQPQQSFAGEYLHRTLPEMAAAYLYYISEGQPFVDGNKRTGVLCAVSFAFHNNCVVVGGQVELAELVVDIAERRLSKADLVRWFQRNIVTPTTPTASVLRVVQMASSE